MTKSETSLVAFSHSALVILSSLGFRHSAFSKSALVIVSFLASNTAHV